MQNLVGIDSAVTDLRMRKNTVLWIYLSICLPVSSSGYTGHSFGPILTVNGSNDVISQPLVPFGGHINIAPYQESNPPPKKKQFWGRE